MCFQKSLLRSVRVGPMISAAAGHRAHLENLELDPFATQNRVSFVPIHLRFHAPFIALGNEHLALQQSQLLAPTPHISTDRTLADAETRHFRTQSLLDAPCRVSLLGRCLPILCQNPINERRRCFQLPQSPLLRLALRRHRTAQCFADHAPVNSQLPRNSGNRPDAELILTTYLLEQLHLRPPR